MTPLTVIFWVAGLAYLFYNFSQIAGYRLSKWLVIFVSAVIVYFSIYLSPHIYQSLYWRTGMLTYTTPLVFPALDFCLHHRAEQTGEAVTVWTAFIFVLALLGGGFSEASCTVLGVDAGAVHAGRRDRLPPEASLGCKDLYPGAGGAGWRVAGDGLVGFRPNHTGPE